MRTGYSRFKNISARLTASWLALALLPALSVLTACGTSESNVIQGNRDKILHLGNRAEPQSIDPHSVASVYDHQIAWALFEGLITLNPYTLQHEPGVAERWEFSEGDKVITFHLNPNARWSNGDPVTAHDFDWSFRRALNPKIASPMVESLYYIAGAEDYFNGVDTDSLGVTAIDPQTLQITLKNPTPYFLDILATMAVAYPVHRPTVEANGGADVRFSGWTRAETFVGNGPYRLSEWKLQQHLAVVKNEAYWGADKLGLEGLIYYPTTNESTEEKMFRTGQLHYTASVPYNKLPSYRAAEDARLRSHPLAGTGFLAINTHRPPLDQLAVRRALSLAVDRDSLAENVLTGTVRANARFVPWTLPGFENQVSTAADIEGARALLAEAGYPNGEGWPGLELSFPHSGSSRKSAVALQQMWKDALNIEVTLSSMEWQVYLSNYYESDYQLAAMGWVNSYMDAADSLRQFVTGDPNNTTHFSNARYDDIMQRLAPQAADRDERLLLMREAEELMLAHLPAIPMYTQASQHLVHPSVRGLPPNPLRYYNFRYVALTNE
ncbi:peptide ABC transporter substrate-binding protein [Halioglobus maricola]|uniref:Peptide ABC transporter substrate-binding protein n=1 Tax=Halioglobus maricola TaxID=2601894 RepID=A0A5P9NNZ3_9GAMM|nr:peptide ABC transporter substrate-binding protein [Halioglobus maricola]QFU77389.1 peptide ABC transporter substrate-binding protein [Halioglobus maricola]